MIASNFELAWQQAQDLICLMEYDHAEVQNLTKKSDSGNSHPTSAKVQRHYIKEFRDKIQKLKNFITKFIEKSDNMDEKLKYSSLLNNLDCSLIVWEDDNPSSPSTESNA